MSAEIGQMEWEVKAYNRSSYRSKTEHKILGYAQRKGKSRKKSMITGITSGRRNKKDMRQEVKPEEWVWLYCRGFLIT